MIKCVGIMLLLLLGSDYSVARKRTNRPIRSGRISPHAAEYSLNTMSQRGMLPTQRKL